MGTLQDGDGDGGTGMGMRTGGRGWGHRDRNGDEWTGTGIGDRNGDKGTETRGRRWRHGGGDREMVGRGCDGDRDSGTGVRDGGAAPAPGQPSGCRGGRAAAAEGGHGLG